MTVRVFEMIMRGVQDDGELGETHCIHGLPPMAIDLSGLAKKRGLSAAFFSPHLLFSQWLIQYLRGQQDIGIITSEMADCSCNLQRKFFERTNTIAC